MDDGTAGVIPYAEMIGAIAIFSLSFSFTWFVIYTTAGSWLKVRLIHIRLDPAVDVPKRYGPMIVSHIVCSVLLVNPWLLFHTLLYLNAQVNSGYLLLTIAILYFWLVGVGTDCLVERVLPRWSRLKWLEYRPPLKRLVLVNLTNLAVGSLAFAVGVVCARIF